MTDILLEQEHLLQDSLDICHAIRGGRLTTEEIVELARRQRGKLHKLICLTHSITIEARKQEKGDGQRTSS